jgi:23S rRNA (guanosine2251-2'-O)-methyltransferase
LVDVDSLAAGFGGSLRPILALAKEQGVPVERVKRAALDRLAQGTVHQGVVALSSAAAYAEPGTVRERALQAGPSGFVLILDGVEDPRNLGALVRTAEAAGVQGVIVPARRAAGLTPVAVKTSAGATEYLPVERVVNLARELRTWKEAGFWVVGSAPDGEKVLYEADLRRPVVVVVGSEGQGLHRLIRESCDEVVRLPMLGHIASLNVSVAGGLLLYEAVRQRSTP